VKRPSLALNRDAIGGFLLRHGEKFGVALVALAAVGLAWGGVNALRLKAVQQGQKPEVIASLAAEAGQHIERVTKPVLADAPSAGSLSDAIEPWRAGRAKVADAGPGVMLDNPLYQPQSRRSKPTLLPIEDLRAVAGVAVLPERESDVADRAAAEMKRQQQLAREQREQDRERPRGDRAADGRPGDGPRPDEQAFNPGLEALATAGPAAVPRGRVVPYVVVTGLVPVAKQKAEFARALGAPGAQDMTADLPRWGAFRVERAVDVPGGKLRWEPLPMKGVQAVGNAAPGPQDDVPQAETLPATFLLGQEEADFGYAAAVPQRIDEPWGTTVVHPWFIPKLKKAAEQQLEEDRSKAAAAPAITPAALRAADLRELVGEQRVVKGVVLTGEPYPWPEMGLVLYEVRSSDGATAFDLDAMEQPGRLVFGLAERWVRLLDLEGGVSLDKPGDVRVRFEMAGESAVARILSIRPAGAADGDAAEITDPDPFPMAGGWSSMTGSEGLDFRLFRYVDTSVKPGQRYRYRIKFAVRNPNFGVPRQLLDDDEAGKGEYLISAESAEAPAVTVPQPAKVLVRTLPKDDMKRMKGGQAEVLVLAPSSETGNYALRSLIAEPGGLLDVVAAFNKGSDIRSRGEDVATGRMLVDLRGPQQVRADLKQQAPPEPLELLVLGPDGSLDLVTAADSRERIDRYEATLPPPEVRGGKATPRPGPAQDGPTRPVNPFGK